jgi:hypothetical protein
VRRGRRGDPGRRLLGRTGTIVGVIGGYQQGGDTPSVSYSPRLGRGIQQLYLQAIG